MGLSSYGSPNDLFKNLFLKKNTLNNNFFKNSSRQVQNFLTSPVKEIREDNYKLHADFCYEVQQQTQKAVGDLIEGCVERTGIKRVCISGGYGMNVVANQYYVQRFPDVEFYFEPLCNDNGISIGAAMNAYIQLEDKVPKPIKNTFTHGSHYDISSYKGVRTSVKEIANLLNENKSVSVYRGLAESGQRALGNRSILFNALNVNAKDIVNRIKKREWYRPFACVVLEEDANIYFEMGRIKKSPHMTMCFPVKSDIIRGVTHVDNTCRIQTVSDGYLYELLQEFKKLSGHGILLNTSFNLAGEPLVETPVDALNTLNNSSLDYLWFEETQQLLER
jgi:carbamoyltransferase